MRQGITMSCVTALLSLLAGCSSQERMADPAPDASGKMSVEMQASNFAFKPNVIAARTGETLVLNVKNVSGERHNITVKSPSGGIIVSKDLPRDETVAVEVPLTTRGAYRFYCDVPLHAPMGMKGRIEVK